MFSRKGVPYWPATVPHDAVFTEAKTFAKVGGGSKTVAEMKAFQGV